jgi:hypothetical protein
MIYIPKTSQCSWERRTLGKRGFGWYPGEPRTPRDDVHSKEGAADMVGLFCAGFIAAIFIVLRLSLLRITISDSFPKVERVVIIPFSARSCYKFVSSSYLKWRMKLYPVQYFWLPITNIVEDHMLIFILVDTLCGVKGNEDTQPMDSARLDGWSLTFRWECICDILEDVEVIAESSPESLCTRKHSGNIFSVELWILYGRELLSSPWTPGEPSIQVTVLAGWCEQP